MGYSKDQEKLVGSIPKNDNTEIQARLIFKRNDTYIDIREYYESPEYSGLTKKGLRFHSENLYDFKALIEKIEKALIESE